MIRPNRAIQAIEQNPEDLFRFICSRTPGAVRLGIRGATVTSIPLPHRLFNYVSLNDIKAGEEREAIEAVQEFFEGRGFPWTWSIGPSSQPSDLAGHLVDAGFTLSYEVPGMALDLRGYSRTAADSVIEVEDGATFDLWMGALLASFLMPPEFAAGFDILRICVGTDVYPSRYFLALDDGRPVAVSMVTYACGVAGIFCVGTIPEARRRGFGEAVMHACLGAALDDGHDVAILHSSRMGRPLYDRLGFQEYCRLAYYAPPAE